MGFARGRDGTTPTSTGASFLAPLGNLEFVHGQFPPVADLMVEVTSLDAAHQSAERWLSQAAAKARLRGFRRLPNRLEIAPLYRRARVWTFTFWAWTDPAKGKPIALEGDLSAEGMRFAIVVARWNAVITDRLLEGASTA